jgi:anti-anti-sigma factor
MADSEPFDITSIDETTVVVFRPSYSQLDEPTIDLVNRKLVDLVSGLENPKLMLDLSNVNFFGSSFIEAMFRVWKRLQSRPDSRFALCGLNPYCREVLEVTHLDKLWPIYATQSEAAAQMAKS